MESNVDRERLAQVIREVCGLPSSEIIPPMSFLMAQDLTQVRKKNADYGNSWNESGAIGVLIRLRDKIARAVTLTGGGKKAEVTDEAVLDTIRDLRVYCYMFEMAWNNPSSESVTPPTPPAPSPED